MSAQNLAPIDPNVKLPPAVLAAAKRADTLMAPVPVEELPAEPVEPAVVEPPVEELQEPAPTFAEGGKVEPQPKPVDENSWEHRYNSMKGRYDGERRRVGELTQQVTLLNQRLTDLENSQQAAPTTPVERERLISQQEEDEFGGEFLSVVARKAREELSPEVTQAKEEIARLNQRIDSMAQSTALSHRDQMFVVLDSKVPDWREINRDEQFLGWLGELDPLAGQVRQTMLTVAFENNDAARVAAFFTGFLREGAAVAPQSGQPDAGTPAKIPLESLAAPGRAKSAAPKSGPAEEPIITRQFITGFYADSLRGKYKGKEAEYARIENAIFAAQRDGRVT